MATDRSSGRLWLEDDTIHHQWSNDSRWDLPVARLKLLGEYTTDHGPFLDDYFFVFISDPESGWLEASFYAEGARTFLDQLGALLGAELSCELYASTDWESRVIWPTDMEGESLFEFTRAAAPFEWWQAIQQAIFPTTHYRLTSSVNSRLKQENPGPRAKAW